MTKNLVLTGMMGSGKSTIGRELSKKLTLKFIDIDKLIEKKEKMPIQKIFSTKGEKYFRRLEQSTCLKILKRSNSVIALGGGSFINPTIRKAILEKSVSFHLDISLNNLKKRKINFKKRPLIKDKENTLALETIYNSRKKVYNLATFSVNCNKLDKVQIIDQICELYEKSNS